MTLVGGVIFSIAFTAMVLLVLLVLSLDGFESVDVVSESSASGEFV
jgi:hypothetical protein